MKHTSAFCSKVITLVPTNFKRLDKDDEPINLTSDGSGHCTLEYKI